MKNMKRALSLVLAMVMMLGMLTIPTGAAGNFTDEDQILNGEAVAITHGMGLFSGYPDGSFKPQGTVTRAQMAVIIVKMLYGSDFDANSLRGTSKFPDVSNFEGGWAEGWINACAQLGVVAGYEDGTFRPGKEVTTAEAVTMIINALKVKPGEGTWPDNYLTKAEEMDLYGDMKVRPGMRAALNRDQLAVLAWEGLDYSTEGIQGYTVGDDTKVFATWNEAADYYKAKHPGQGVDVTAINEVKDNLAKDVFGLKKAEGFVIGNQATGEEVTLVGSADGKFNIKTGLDMIGHKVTVYYKEAYKNENQPGTTYCVIDETTAITVNEAVDTEKEYRTAFGGERYETAASIKYFDSTYVLDTAITTLGADYVVGSKAPRGTYIIDEEGYIVAFVKPAAEVASYVVDVNTFNGQESILISGANGGAYIPNNADEDKIVEYKGIAAGDFVMYTKVGDVYSVTKVATVSGAMTRLDYKEVNGEANVPVVTIGGVQYAQFTGDSYVKGKLDTKVTEMAFGQNYTLYLTADSRIIGYETAASTVSSDMVYLLGVLPVTSNDNYGTSVLTYNGRGVDLNGKEVLVPLAKVLDANKNKVYDNDETYIGMDTNVVTAGFYTIEDATEDEAKKEGLKVVEPVSDHYDGTGMFQLTLNTAKTGYYGTGFLATNDSASTLAKSGSNSKVMYIDGAVDSDTPLSASIVGLGTIDLPVGTTLLVSRLADGASNQVEMFVLMQKPTNVTTVYVTADQLAEASQTAVGYELTAYNAKTAENRSLTLESLEGVTAGRFYSAEADEEGIYTLTPVNTGTNGVGSSIKNGDSAKDVVYMNRGYYGSAKSAVLFLKNDADNDYKQPLYSGAKVVDLRSDEEIAESGVARLDSTSQIISLKNNNPGLVVVMDMYGVQGDSVSASVIYVKKALIASPGFEGVVYAENGPGASGTVILQAVDSPARDAGELVQVTFDKCDTPNQPGFYTYSVNVDGELTLTFSEPSATLGLHNLIDAIDENGVVTASDYGSCTCGGCNGSSEIHEFTITDSTLIYNKDGSMMTLDQLRELVENDFATVNYSCDVSGNADIIFVYDNGLNEFATDAGVVYVSGGTGFTQGNKAAFKGYYAKGAIAPDVEKDFMVKVTNTINPSTNAPGAGSFYERDAEGNLSLLGIDSGKVAYHNYFWSYENGTLTVTTETEPFHAESEHAGFICTGEDEEILTVSGLSDNLPVVGIDGISTIVELQAWVEANPEKMPPLVSYYIEDGQIAALYGESSGGFEYDLKSGDAFYIGELPTPGNAANNDTVSRTTDKAYIITGVWAGKKFTLNYGGYQTSPVPTEKARLTGFINRTYVRASKVQVRIGAWASVYSDKAMFHQVFEKVEDGVLYAYNTGDALGKFCDKLTESHASNAAAGNDCNMACNHAAELTSMDVSGRVTVYDMRPDADKAALPIETSLAGLQAAYDNNIAVYINSYSDGVEGNPRAIFIVDAEQVEF